MAVCLSVLFASCSNDDEGGTNVPASVFQPIQAEWYSPDAERYMSFEYMQVQGTVYQNMSTFPEIAESFSGQWMYTKGGVLGIEILYDKSLKSGDEDWYVLQCDETTLKMRHAKLNLTLDFYKIVESHQGRIGDRFDIDYVKSHPEFSSATYTTSNAGIADVDNGGHVTIRGGGLAFITISSLSGSVVVRVDGGQRVNSYTAEILETIDQVIARHGEPDMTRDTGTGLLAIVYQTPEKIIDSAVAMLGYEYDPDTREVTTEEILYKDEADRWLLSDEEYLNREFYLYFDIEGVYVPNQSLVDNHFFVQVLRSATGKGLIVYRL